MYYSPNVPEPLCGWPWYHQHARDHTQAEVDSLAIEVRVDDRLQGHIKAGEKKARGIVSEIVRINRG